MKEGKKKRKAYPQFRTKKEVVPRMKKGEAHSKECAHGEAHPANEIKKKAVIKKRRGSKPKKNLWKKKSMRKNPKGVPAETSRGSSVG